MTTSWTVDNPTVIDAGTVDPAEDAPTFAQSALNNLFDAFDDAIVYGAWFSGEAWEGDSFPTRTDIGRRNIDFVEGTGSTNGTLDTDIYSPLARAIATGERVQDLLAEESGPAADLNVARAAFASGYATLLEAELFCTVVISSGQDDLGDPLTSEQGAAEAATRFQRVIDLTAGQSSADAALLGTAARVGLARARLLQGDYAGAIAAAGQVPEASSSSFPRWTILRTVPRSGTRCTASPSSAPRWWCRRTTGRSTTPGSASSSARRLPSRFRPRTPCSTSTARPSTTTGARTCASPPGWKLATSRPRRS